MRIGSDFVTVQETIKEAIEKIQELHEFEGEITGIPTGFKDFDKQTAGLQPSDLIIVAGRPAMGKTTLAMNIAEHAALKNDVSGRHFQYGNVLPSVGDAVVFITWPDRPDEAENRKP